MRNVLAFDGVGDVGKRENRDGQFRFEFHRFGDFTFENLEP